MGFLHERGLHTHTHYNRATRIEYIKEFFQIEVMTNSPSPNFFQIEDIAFWGRSAIIFSIWKKKGDQRSIFAVNCHEILEKSLIITYNLVVLQHQNSDKSFPSLGIFSVFWWFPSKAAGPTFFLPHDNCISNRSNKSHLLLSGRGPYNGLGPYTCEGWDGEPASNPIRVFLLHCPCTVNSQWSPSEPSYQANGEETFWNINLGVFCGICEFLLK